MDLGTVQTLEQRLRVQCEALDPDSVPLPEVPALFRELDHIDRLATGAKLRLLRRLDDVGVATAAGQRSTAEWVAGQTGTTVGAARESLDTSKRLGSQSATDEAVAKGEVSNEQAKAVSDAAAADPAAERTLLDSAKKESVKDLKRRCAETKANAEPDPAKRREAIRKNRCLRTFRDREGGWNLQVRHLPEVGAEIEALLAPFTHRRFEAARQGGDRESTAAYGADALLDLARASTAGGHDLVPRGASRAETKVFVHIDLDTLLRGRTISGSICRIEGVGPVDVDWVRAIYGEAFAVAIIEDAVDVRAVVHLGRQVTAAQRSALEARGYKCEIPGCAITHGLEIDHIDGWALTRRTTLNQLMWACGHHHDQKTRQGYRMSGAPGARVWTAPDGTEHRDQPTATNTGAGPPGDPPDPAPPDRPETTSAQDEPTLFADPSAA